MYTHTHTHRWLVGECLTDSLVCIAMTDALQAGGRLAAERAGASGSSSPATTGKAHRTRGI